MSPIHLGGTTNAALFLAILAAAGIAANNHGVVFLALMGAGGAVVCYTAQTMAESRSGADKWLPSAIAWLAYLVSNGWAVAALGFLVWGWRR